MKTSQLTRSAILHGTILALTLLVTSLRAEQFGPFTYMLTGDTVAITGYSIAGVGEVVIPAEIEGKPVVGIGAGAFFRRGVTSVVIPGSVTEIGGFPFDRCPALTSIDVEPLNAFYSSVDGVLFDKNKTTLLKYPAGKPMRTYRVPGGVAAIGRAAFSSSVFLSSVTIPEGVIEIGTAAFGGCTSLTSVTIPGSVTEIGRSAFSGCTSLARVTIEEGVKTIGSTAFEECISLTNVIIPASVTEIGNYAFCGCYSLGAALFLGDRPNGDFDLPPFVNVGEHFVVYYLPTSDGFPLPPGLTPP